MMGFFFFFDDPTDTMHQENILCNVWFKIIKYISLGLAVCAHFAVSASATSTFKSKESDSGCVLSHLTLHLWESSVPSAESVTQHH